MKKVYILLLFLCMLALPGLAQPHLKWMKGPQAGIGVSKFGMFAKVGGFKNLSGKRVFTADIMYERGQMNVFRLSAYHLNTTYFFSFKMLDRLFFNIGPGLTINMSELRANTEIRDLRFKYLDIGVMAGAELNYYPSDRFGFVLSGNQRYFITRNLGTVAWHAGFGFKYVI